MTSKNRSFLASLIGILLAYQNCGGSGGSKATVFTEPAGPNLTQPLSISGTEAFVVPISVGCGYVNEPCVSVTVCVPGSSNCLVVNNLLLDTGSYGLRVFSSAVSSLGLTQMQDSSNHAIAECQSYKDGSSDWGPVVRADVKLGGRTASNIPIQIIDYTFGTPPSDCTDLETDANSAGYSGILGVGVFAQDCGSTCVDAVSANNRIYFDCSASSLNCENNSIAVPLHLQVTNPVSQLDMDNNGVILQMPNVSNIGQNAVMGYLILGIGTEPQNTPSWTVQTFKVDSAGDFYTNYDNVQLPGFIDSGSNGTFFPNDNGWNLCNNLKGFYCPTSGKALFATQIGADSANNNSVQVNVVNADDLAATNGNAVAFSNLAGPLSGFFDWGMPFFYGRTIYFGLENQSSPMGQGPQWSY